jgi:hypothetical protein
MSYDIYRYIFIGAAILGGVMLVVSAVLFFVLKIPKVIGDLSGATARKAIKNIREQNEASGDKAYKASAYNEARGRLTDKISPSGRIVQPQGMQGHGGHGTTKIATQYLNDNGEDNQTTVLDAANETTVLGTANETTVLDTANQTTLLSNRTVDLDVPDAEAGVTGQLAPAAEPVLFEIEYEITYIHSNELIDGGVWA